MNHKPVSKPTIVCVFAHPDDESFGPGGTIAKLSPAYDIYLICVTDGNDPNKEESLGNIRQQELLDAAEILGIKKVHFLEYPDGSLNNNIYHELVADVKVFVDQYDADVLLTFEPRGVSGHIDHVVCSYVTTYIFERQSPVKELWYYCISHQEAEGIRDDYFIYFPPGYQHEDVDKTVDISSVYQTKVKAMKTHRSQLKDVEQILANTKDLPRQEYFLVRKKD